MYSLTAENKYGEQLELTHNDAYVIKSIEGIDPPEAVINTTRNANADGSIFNSSYIDNRTIIITLAINAPAEINRINLYKYFPAKYPVRLHYKNGSRDVFIDGYVRSVQVDPFNKKEIAQITILCPETFFSASSNNITDFTSVEDNFEFPFSVEDPPGYLEFGQILLDQNKNIINVGDVETGIEFYIRAMGSITNPIIYNVDTNEFFKLSVNMVIGDEIYINTKKKQKTVTMTHNAVTTNIIGNLVSGSTWFQLTPGDNIMMVTADNHPENLNVYCVLTDMFEGV